MEGKELLLHDLDTKPQCDTRDLLIKQVKKGMYSDFASPLTFPVTELVNKLNELGYQDMVKKTINGEYDHDE